MVILFVINYEFRRFVIRRLENFRRQKNLRAFPNFILLLTPLFGYRSNLFLLPLTYLVGILLDDLPAILLLPRYIRLNQWLVLLLPLHHRFLSRFFFVCDFSNIWKAISTIIVQLIPTSFLRNFANSSIRSLYLGRYRLKKVSKKDFQFIFVCCWHFCYFLV